MQKFSVLISLYSKEEPRFLECCLQSLVEQTVMPDEVVIVFDGFVSENLQSVVSGFADVLNLVIVRLPNNVGLGAALNIGLEHCSYDYVARLDTDDVCMPSRFELQLKAFNHSDVDILGTNAIVIDFFGEEVGTKCNPESHDEIVSMLWCNPLIHPSVMYRKKVIQSLGGYKDSLRRRQDYDLWFRAARANAKFGNVNIPLIFYRADKLSLKKQSPKLAFEQGMLGFRGTYSLGFGFFRSLACFFPFLKSLLPYRLQHRLATVFEKFDPRG